MNLLIANKLDFKSKLVKRNKEDDFRVIKNILQLYELYMGAFSFLREILLDLKPKINLKIMIGNNLNIPLSPIQR